MRTLLRVVVVLSLLPTLSCAKTVAPDNAIPAGVDTTAVISSPPTPATTLPLIAPPVSNKSSADTLRKDPSLPSLAEMYLAWTYSELPYFGIDVDLEKSTMSADQAINLGKAWFTAHDDARKGVDVDSLQAVLVRFTADPKFPEFDRQSWFIVAPPVMGLQLEGPAQQVTSRDSSILYFWADDFTLLMDDQTGDVWGGTPRMHVGHIAPRLTVNQFEVIQKYADSYGWWAVWYRLKEYNGGFPPQSAIDEMKL